MNHAVIRVQQAAFIASDCVERVHDLTSLETAGQATVNYVVILAQTSPEDQQTAKDAFQDIPTLGKVLHALKVASASLNQASFAGALAQVS